MPKKMAMVGWFDPAQLINTAIRVVISTVFGQFADKREALAAANPISDSAIDPHCDYASRYTEGDFWFDYVADVGDGWNPTYAIARLLAEDALSPRGAAAALPRGRVLVMGGDEVYPTASIDEYENRLVYPYQVAYEPENGMPRWPGNDDARPDLFAVPGNHDWYDGLRTFFYLVCRRTIKAPGEAAVNRNGKVIGGRQTHQTRSYFALKLPYGWWLWGTDSQLEGYIDQPQIDFFQFVAQSWMEEGSKLILCTGTPDWEYVDPKAPEGDRNRPEKRYSTLSYLERLAPGVRGKGHQLKLVLSGDNHHYVRYREGSLNYITCGGGGAFLHPTHQLESKQFDFAYPPPGIPLEEGKPPYKRSFRIATKGDRPDGEEAMFPSRAVSARLAAGNIAFAFRNPKLTATLAPLYLLFTWLLDFNARSLEGRTLAAQLRPGNLWQAMAAYWRLVFSSPWPVLLCGIAAVGYYYFASCSGRRRLALGGGHALLQALLVTATTCAAIRLLPAWTTPWGGGLTLVVAGIAAAIVSATLIGLYLWACLSWWGIHWGHFSSLAVQDYKCFLRLHIDGEGKLHVHPIGLRKVPDDRGRTSGPPPHLYPELIEPAIVIDA